MNKLRKLIISGISLALCLLLPFLTGNIPQIGNALSPMHIPILICGFVCGWPYGLVTGFAAPLLRYAILGMPPMPICIAMAFELAAYGAFSGILYRLLPKKLPYLYVSLVTAMLCGRAVWGAAMMIILSVNGNGFTWAAFISGAFASSLPGIVLHIALIPPVVLGLKRAGFINITARV